MSANTWGPGSIYGTVEFQFDWANMIEGRRIYWVEAMMDYRPPAYRFLLSRRDYIPGGLITPYNPTTDGGPLQLRNGVYYWNVNYTSEFMIEEDIPVDRCTGFRFVSHHTQYCQSYGQACDDRRRQPEPSRTGSKMLSFILGSGRHTLDQQLKPEGSDNAFIGAYADLEDFLPRMVQFHGPTNTDAACQLIVRGALALYGTDQVDQARRLLSLIRSRDNFRQALKMLVRDHFGDPSWEPHIPAF